MALSIWWKLMLPLIPAYVFVARSLRHRRRKEMHRKLGFATTKSLSDMTLEDAFTIHDYLAHLEFPKVFSLATMFAIFKTYGIPSISKLLVATGQLSADKLKTSKRWADTSALLLEAVLNPPGSTRADAALNRVNFLHNIHRRKGRISDSDMLYTLSLFALEPQKWVSNYEWRELTDTELCAVGKFWCYLGEAFQVPYDELPSYQKGWSSGLEWLRELQKWSQDYEIKYMVGSKSNKQLADSTISFILDSLPSAFKSSGRRLVATLLEDRLREAMLIDRPPQVYHQALTFIVSVRKAILRNAMLPRKKRAQYLSEPTRTGRLHMLRYRTHPWYVLPTRKQRWSAKSWRIWMTGGSIPGDEGDKFHPEGYLSQELGPDYASKTVSKDAGVESANGFEPTTIHESQAK